MANGSDLKKQKMCRSIFTCLYNLKLKTAFQIGFLLFLPFLVIDMVVLCSDVARDDDAKPNACLASFQAVFVLVDGWAMTVGSLVATYTA